MFLRLVGLFLFELILVLLLRVLSQLLGLLLVLEELLETMRDLAVHLFALAGRLIGTDEFPIGEVQHRAEG